MATSEQLNGFLESKGIYSKLATNIIRDLILYKELPISSDAEHSEIIEKDEVFEILTIEDLVTVKDGKYVLVEPEKTIEEISRFCLCGSNKFKFQDFTNGGGTHRFHYCVKCKTVKFFPG